MEKELNKGITMERLLLKTMINRPSDRTPVSDPVEEDKQLQLRRIIEKEARGEVRTVA